VDTLVFHEISSDTKKKSKPSSMFSIDTHKALRVISKLSKNYRWLPWKKGKLQFTFDDGYRIPCSVLNLLEDSGHRTILFINASTVLQGRTPVGPGSRDKLMDQRYLFEILNKFGNLEVGDHNWEHKNLKSEANSSFRDGLIKTESIFSRHGLKVHSYAWPYGLMNPEQIPILLDFGYQELYLGSAVSYLKNTSMSESVYFRTQVDKRNFRILTIRGSLLLNRILA